MKNTLLLAVAAVLTLLLSTAPAKAQQFGRLSYSGEKTTSYTGGTNKAVALSTNAYFTIDCNTASELALYCNYKFLAAPGAGDATSIRVDFYQSIGGGRFETNAWTSWTVVGNSTTPVGAVTNLTLKSVPQLRCRIANTSTNAHATNITFSFGFKH